MPLPPTVTLPRHKLSVRPLGGLDCACPVCAEIEARIAARDGGAAASGPPTAGMGPAASEPIPSLDGLCSVPQPLSQQEPR